MKKLFILLVFIIFGLLTNCKQTLLETENIPEINPQEIINQVGNSDPVMDRAFKAFIWEEKDWLRKYVNPIAYKESKGWSIPADEIPSNKKLLKELLGVSPKEFQKIMKRFYNLYIPEERKFTKNTKIEEEEEKVMSALINRYIYTTANIYK